MSRWPADRQPEEAAPRRHHLRQPLPRRRLCRHEDQRLQHERVHEAVHSQQQAPRAAAILDCAGIHDGTIRISRSFTTETSKTGKYTVSYLLNCTEFY